MSEMNIRKEAWWKAAESDKGKSCKLSLEIVKELRDKQSNALLKQHLAKERRNCFKKWVSIMRQNGVVL